MVFRHPFQPIVSNLHSVTMNILVTQEGQPVFWDGKGNFSLEKDDDFYMAAHFQKVLPDDDPEAFRQKAAEQLGIYIHIQYEEY